MNDLTHDNSHYQGSAHTALSGLLGDLQPIARSNVQLNLPEGVRRFVSQSISENTRRAYTSDLRRFQRWGGAIPSDPVTIAIYLSENAGTHVPSTLQRWLSSISRAHTAASLDDPTKIEPAISTMKGICRTVGMASEGASPLLRDDLLTVLDAVGDSIRDRRDRALLLIGFGGGLRRSELVGLDAQDLDFVRRGIVINIRQSKTDQEGRGRQIAIPLGRCRHCPVMALETWLETSQIREGPIFRPINRHGHVATARLSGEAVASVVKERVAAIGLDPTDFSGHSLRSGFATSAAVAGVSSWKIRQQTGHTSDAMLARYIRSAELFEGNAAGAVL